MEPAFLIVKLHITRRQMNPVQELIDEHCGEMPVAVAKKLLDACKEEYERRMLYRVTFTKVTAVLSTEDNLCKLQHITQTIIAEPITPTEFRDIPMSVPNLLNDGKIHTSWIQDEFPWCVTVSPDTWCDEPVIIIVHAIEPYVAKRRRD